MSTAVTKSAMHRGSYRYGLVRLKKRAGSGVWYMDFFNPKRGRWQRRSTGTTDKRCAELEADRINEALKNNRFGIIDDTITLDELFSQCFAAKEGEIKASSLGGLMRVRSNLKRWMKETGTRIRRASDLTTDLIRRFRRYRLEDEGVSERTVNDDVTSLCTIYKWGIREQLVSSNPADYSKQTGRIKLYKLPHKEKSVYTHAEVQALIAEAGKQGDIQIRDLIVVFANTGARFEEVAHMTPKWLRWDTQKPAVVIRADGDWTPKHAKEVKAIPMTPAVEEVIRRRAKGCTGYLFTNGADNKIAENKTLERLKTLFPAVGIDRTKRRLHWHAFRRYFVKTCMEKGVPLNTLMRWTGHDTVSMALEYAPSDYTDSCREIERLVPNPAPSPADSNQPTN